MYWKHGTGRIQSPKLPFVTAGTPFDLTLTLVTEAGENYADVFLCMRRTGYNGLIQAKRHDDSEYMDLTSPLDPNCYLGALVESSELDIDFRISIDAGDTDGLYALPVTLMLGENLIPPPNTFWTNVYEPELWSDNYDTPELWADSY